MNTLQLKTLIKYIEVLTDLRIHNLLHLAGEEYASDAERKAQEKLCKLFNISQKDINNDN